MANAYFGPKSMKNGILILIDQKNSLVYYINAKKSMKIQRFGFNIKLFSNVSVTSFMILLRLE